MIHHYNFLDVGPLICCTEEMYFFPFIEKNLIIHLTRHLFYQVLEIREGHARPIRSRRDKYRELQVVDFM